MSKMNKNRDLDVDWNEDTFEWIGIEWNGQIFSKKYFDTKIVPNFKSLKIYP